MNPKTRAYINKIKKHVYEEQIRISETGDWDNFYSTNALIIEPVLIHNNCDYSICSQILLTIDQFNYIVDQIFLTSNPVNDKKTFAIIYNIDGKSGEHLGENPELLRLSADQFNTFLLFSGKIAIVKMSKLLKQLELTVPDMNEHKCISLISIETAQRLTHRINNCGHKFYMDGLIERATYCNTIPGIAQKIYIQHFG
jgi:DNA integrity scanning protein DisA with diadenylate cyclase activity